MAKKTTIKAAPRARTGSGLLKQMRREGWLPSVIYGRGTQNMNLKVDAKAFSEVIAHSSSENIVVNLEIEGEGARMAFLKDVQHDALSGKALHADFLAIDSSTEITAQIPAHIVGEAPGVKAGGVIEQYLHALEIVSLPDDLPETIEIDVSNLQLGDNLLVGDVTYPKGVRPNQAEDVVIIHIGRAGAGPVETEVSEEATAETVAPPATEE